MNKADPNEDERTVRLVEYLDGESTDAASSEIEGELARDPAVRRQVEVLQRAWDLLEFLPMPAAKPDFRRRTVQMATQELAPPLDGASSGAKRRSVGFLAAGVLGVAFLVGAAAALVRPGDDRRLLENRSLLENLDDYRAVGDLKFLDMLHAEKMIDHMDSLLEPGP
jgi:anti-sigma factor RsiW